MASHNPFVYRKYATDNAGHRYVTEWHLVTDDIEMRLVENFEPKAGSLYELRQHGNTRYLEWTHAHGWRARGQKLDVSTWSDACRAAMAA